MVPDYRKPLIVVAPKVLLRHPKAASCLTDLAPGTSFQDVIDDKTCSKQKVNKVDHRHHSEQTIDLGHFRFWKALDSS